MTKFHTLFKTLLAACFTLAVVPVVHAQASRTWVSGVGDDADSCSRTSPCRSFSRAHTATAVNGEINCLDTGSYGGVTITKSITINCHDVFSGTTASSTQGVLINYDLFDDTDTRKSVHLRNLNFNGLNTGQRGIRISSSTAIPGTNVHIEDCVIDGAYGTPGRGIEDNRNGGGKLFITNTTIRNVSGAAISFAPFTGSGLVNITIDKVQIYNCQFGIAIGSGGTVVVTNSVISSCSSAGLHVEGNFEASDIHANNVVLNHNGIGLEQSGVGTIRIANSQITNSTANGTVGTIFSYGNNRTLGNAGVTTLTPVGADSHSKGEQ